MVLLLLLLLLLLAVVLEGGTVDSYLPVIVGRIQDRVPGHSRRRWRIPRCGPSSGWKREMR